MNLRRIRQFCLAIAVAITGCAHDLPPLPKYGLEDPDSTQQFIRARTASLKQATGQGELTLENAADKSVVLDAAFVLQPPDHARFRAWKFNQAVFDLTLSADGTWLYSPRSDASMNSSHLGEGIRQWLGYLNTGIPDRYSVASATDQTIVLSSNDPGGGVLTTTIDRPTRTVRSYRLVDPGGSERFTLSLDRYRDFAGTLWPTQIIARSQTGTITLNTRDLQPGVAAPAAFIPPPRATRLP